MKTGYLVTDELDGTRIFFCLNLLYLGLLYIIQNQRTYVRFTRRMIELFERYDTATLFISIVETAYSRTAPAIEC